MQKPYGVVVSAGRTLAFAERHTTKFAAPHHKRRVEQPALLEVGQQCGDGLIHLGTEKAVVFLNTLVSVPSVLEVSASGVKLDEPNAATAERKPGVISATGLCL